MRSALEYAAENVFFLICVWSDAAQKPRGIEGIVARFKTNLRQHFEPLLEDLDDLQRPCQDFSYPK